MISKEGIRNLYKAKQPRQGYSKEYLHKICNKCSKHFKMDITDGFVVIGSLDNHNPFKRIKYSRIKSIQDLGDEVAIVFGSCILFLNNITGKININVRTTKTEIIVNKLNLLFARFIRLFRTNQSHNYNSIG